MKCYACFGTGRHYTVLAGTPTLCRFCEGDGTREVCDDFTPQHPDSVPDHGQPCGECGHPRRAH